MSGNDIHHKQFSIGGLFFEYDEDKNRMNIAKHGVSFQVAARVFFDYDRIEMYDEENSAYEDRYDTIGNAAIGTVGKHEDILFVVYTDRVRRMEQELQELEEARKKPLVFDDCPETTPERALKFRRVNRSLRSVGEK